MARTFELKQTKTVELQSLVHLPAAYEEDASKRWPLILFLHGAGERGDDVWKAATHGPPKLIREGRDLPFVVVTPLCPSDERWQSDTLLVLIEKIQKDYRIDSARLYLTGLSMGGYGTWDLGMKRPDLFAAIAPICGGGQAIDVLLASRENAAALKTLGVWAFHGAKDNVVQPDESERMIRFLKNAGCEDVKLTIYPEAGHDSWTETYNNPEFFEWLLRHERRMPGE